MPSYIELEKNSSIPASSGASKVIIGIDENGKLISKDNDGNININTKLYKSYKALITQSGGSGISSISAESDPNTLTIGRVYTIDSISEGDFSNIAEVISGTINTVGCIFIAIGTNPAIWSDTTLTYVDGAPIATILDNELSGKIIWSYSGVGTYIGTLTNAFPEGKLFIPTYGNIFSNVKIYDAWITRIDVNTITIYSSNKSTNSDLQDGVLTNFMVEIQVYN